MAFSNPHRSFFYLTIAASLILTASYCLGVYFAWPFVGEYREWTNYVVKKERIIRMIGDRPKIILDGGSATLYGVRAKDLEEAFGIPAVNNALCAGFDLDYIFYGLKKVARRGDIVILPLEYELFFYDGSTSSFKASYILSNDREYFLHALPWGEKFDYFRHIIGFSKVFKAAKKSHSKRPRPWPLGMLNENGDIIGNVGKHNLAGLGPAPAEPGEIRETKGLALIKEFSRWAKANGVTVYVSYANRVYSKDIERKEFREYYPKLKRYLTNNGIAVLGTPYDFFFPEELFYDTLYHLNETGTTLRTQRLIDMLATTYPEVFKIVSRAQLSAGTVSEDDR
jgi:hypothetical protein